MRENEMPDLLVNVNKDGTIEPQDKYEIETHYQSCHGFYIDHENEFLGVISDAGGFNSETRITFDTLREAGFTIPDF